MTEAMLLDKLKSEGYSKDQIYEIEEGLKAGLDVSRYADKELFATQMRQIRFGLQEGLEVSLYASREYDWFQMEEIRLGLKDGLKVALYANPSISYEQMRQIRLGLKDGIDLTQHLHLSPGILRELRKAIGSKVNLVPYIQEGYGTEQLEQIRLALENGVKIRPYLVPQLRGVSIREIRLGLEKGLDVGIYAKADFSWQQMREIRLGLEGRLEVAKYVHPFYSWEQMHEIRLGLKNGMHVESYASFMYTPLEMHNKRLEMQKQVQQLGLEYILKELSETAYADHPAITISPDEMEAYAELTREDKNLSREDVMAALKRCGVSHGILEESIALLLGGKANRRVLIARGQKPEHGKDGWYEYFFRLLSERAPKMLEDGSVDYKNTEWFEMVRKDQTVAVYHPAEDGADGYTVTGRVLHAQKGREKNMLAGRGFYLLPDQKTYRSLMDGRVEQTKDGLEITSMLILDEVTPNTGNVDFDGGVYVKGNVIRGALIKATRDVLVDGFVEASIIQCGGNLIIRKGANGSGGGFLQVGKSLIGNFLESVKARVKEDVQANYCLNCDLYVEGHVTVSGSSGSLAGGLVHAIRGLSVYNMGNRVGLKTVVKLGINESIRQQKVRMEEEIKEINQQMNILGNGYLEFQRKYPPEIRNSMEMYLKIERAIYTKEKELENVYLQKLQLEGMIQDTVDVEAYIRGTLFEGVTVEINGLSWAARSVMNVTLRRSRNKIAIYSN